MTSTHKSGRHTVQRHIEFPDDTSTWVCTCGQQGTPTKNIDYSNHEFRLHRIANNTEQP